MASYTLAEARERFDELIEKAAAGEEVVIEREGGRDVVLESRGPERMTRQEEIEWLRQRRVTPSKPTDSTALIRAMRDEGL